MRPRGDPLRKALLLSFLLTTTALLADGTFPLVAPARIDAAADRQIAPVVASNGLDFFSAWTTLTPVGQTGQTVSTVYTTLVRAEGSLGWDIGTSLDPDAVNSYGVSVTQGRDGFFAAWMSENGLNAAVIDSFGRVERRTVVAQEDPEGTARTIAAWNGAAHLVISGFNTAFLATLFDNNGDVIAAGLDVGNTHGGAMPSAVVADSHGFLVLAAKTVSYPWRSDIYGRRISASGSMGEWFLIRGVASLVSGIAVVYDGSQDVIVWSDRFGLWTMRLDPATNTVDASRHLSPDPVVLSGATRAGSLVWVATWDGQSSQVRVTAIGSDGSIVESRAIGQGYAPNVASNGTRALVVRQVTAKTHFLSPSDFDIVGQFFDAGATTGDFTVARSETDQQNSQLTPDGDGLLAVWDEAVHGERQIVTARLDASMRMLDGAGMVISNTGHHNVLPAAASNGSTHLIVWVRIDEGRLRLVGRRYSAGAPIDTADILIADDPRWGAPAAVASDGLDWVVVWSGRVPRSGCGSNPLFASRIGADGSVQDAARELFPGSTFNQVEPHMVWTGKRYLLSWTNQCSGSHQPLFTSIGTAFLAPDLSAVDAATLTPIASTQFGASVGRSRVVAGRERSLVVWESNASGVMTTAFRMVSDSSFVLRRRAIAEPQPSSIEGTLVAAGRTQSGELSILTKSRIPWLPPYDGLYETIVGADGVQGTTTLLSVGTPGDYLIGNLVVQPNGARSMIERTFDRTAGAQRLRVRLID